jgi:cytoskeletal protein CcmA (bactofilin family)
MSDLKTTDKTSIVDSINEIYDDIHTTGSVTLNTEASHLVGAINEIEGVFDASTYEISAGANDFNVTSGTFTIDSTGDIVLDAADDDIILKEAGDEFGRFTSTAGHQLVLKSGANQTFLTASNTNATFNNNLTVENNLDVDGTLNADGATTLNGTTIDGNLDLNGSVDISVNAVIHGTTELNNTLGVDGNFRVGVNKFNVVAASGNTQIDGTLEVDGTAGVDGNF